MPSMNQASMFQPAGTSLNANLTTLSTVPSDALGIFKLAGVSGSSVAWRHPALLLGFTARYAAWIPYSGTNVAQGSFGTAIASDFGTPTANITGFRPGMTETTSPSANTSARIYSTADVAQPRHNPGFFTIVRPLTTVLTRRDWHGYTTAATLPANSGTSASDSLVSAHGIAFRYSTNAGDTTWKLCRCDGSTQTATDTTVTFTADHDYILAVWTLDAGVTWTWYCYDLTNSSGATGTVSTTLPGTSQSFRMSNACETLTTAARATTFYGMVSHAAGGNAFP